MAYKLEDYRRIGSLWYPVKISQMIIQQARGGTTIGINIEVIDEPKDERAMLDMVIEAQRKEVEYWKRNGKI